MDGRMNRSKAAGEKVGRRKRGRKKRSGRRARGGGRRRYQIESVPSTGAHSSTVRIPPVRSGPSAALMTMYLG